ncbi:hypothetical protein Q5762_07555 [Streptomyces sp. P9(2023)]|uniref:hypothetical protein n=1 Tax=Streptomyces sp. P9(2023) TaxID=3064394 RepID=UPI0028F43303|nr:hypothetical protein [Streptomyces sp. P9(2023)]MDT9688212.1 hypothetical protein [Streptomyces sp. P9(2023)]
MAESGAYGFLPLSGALGAAEVGTAVMRIAECNSVDLEGEPRRPQRPADPLGHFLHGLLTLDELFAPGGLRVTDTTTGVVLSPGCCNGLDERGDWPEVIDGAGWASFGHDPSPFAERVGDVVRLTVDAERQDSPVIELPLTDLRGLIADAERDLIAFLRLAAEWAALHLCDYADPVGTALARALDLPAPALPAPALPAPALPAPVLPPRR